MGGAAVSAAQQLLRQTKNLRRESVMGSFLSPRRTSIFVRITAAAETDNAIVRSGNIHLDIGSAMDDIDRIERRLKLHDVRVLLSVVQAGSMHKAAERLANVSARHFQSDRRPRTRARRPPARSHSSGVGRRNTVTRS